MVEELDRESLFCGRDQDDDLDSLFDGSGDELSSFFSEVAAVAPSREPKSETASPLQGRAQEAANMAAQLRFPEAPAQTQSQAQKTPQSTPAVVRLTLPAVPDPLAPLLSQQDGHTSGDLVVSTQDSDYTTPAPAPATSLPDEWFDSAALQDQLEVLWESTTSEDQPVNAQTGSQISEPSHDSDLIPVTRIPGFRYANSMVNVDATLPRRLDLDPKLAEELMYWVTLNRQTKFEVLYHRLELNYPEGKRLGDEVRKLLQKPLLCPIVERTTRNRVLETKRTLVRTAFYILVTEDWGTTWFGDGCATAESRTLFWPRDSSLLLLNFVMLLYRILQNVRQTHRIKMKYQRESSEALSIQSSTPPPSPPPCTPLISPPESPPPSSKTQDPFNSLVENITAAKKRKHAESVLGLAASEASAAAGHSDNPYELEIPVNARLTYHVYGKDKTDGSDLGPPAIYRHTDALIVNGAFAGLTSSFEGAGHVPSIVIQSPFGRREITSAEEWESAVLAIYNVRRSGGVVEVDVFV